METKIDHNALYRLPWTLPDNAISWLEPTVACNLACEGCYRANVPGGHKTLAQIRHELRVFKSLRKTDGISIAGGDPLLHPDIVEIVRMVTDGGLKPIVNTNGQALTRELLRDLKRAGVVGFTFHVDSKQHRPHWKGKNEVDLNELRLSYAEMLAEAGGICCAFNSTVYSDTLEYTPLMLAWAQEHIDIVHTMVFIAFRAVAAGEFTYYAGAERVEMGSLVSYTSALLRNPLRAVRPLRLQSVMIIQPVDTFPDGRMSMCDGCPDITVWEDEIVWPCRLEEKMKFGSFVRAIPLERVSQPAADGGGDGHLATNRNDPLGMR